MSTASLYRRIRRRETHSSRAVPAIAVAVVAILALAWLVAETVLAAVGGTALLLSPASMVQGIAALTTVAAGLLIAAGVVLALIGLGLVLLALRPGRLGRHTIDDDRAVVVVHDEVTASALVRTAADVSATDPDRAVASVGRRRARVRVAPASGVEVDRAAVESAVDERLGGFGLVPALRASIGVDRRGRVGA